MQYIYSDKSFAANLFDATKSKLQMPATGWTAMPDHWSSLIHYGEHVSAFSRKMKFRSMPGKRLRIDSMPLCTQDPALIGRLRQTAKPATSQGSAQTAAQDWGMDAFSLGTDGGIPVSGNSSPAQGPPSAEKAHDAAASGRTPASLRASARIPTAVVSTLLSIAAAVTAGIIVGNTSTFQFNDGNGRDKSPRDLLADNAPQAADEGTATRLALEPALPASYKVYPEAAAAAAQSPDSARKQKPASSARRTLPMTAREEIKATASRPASRKIRSQHKAAVSNPKSDTSSLSTATNKAAPASAAAGSSHTRSVQLRQLESYPGTQYARCEKLRGLLRRERCKWDVCGGKWGKQGCPAYQHNAMPEFGYGRYGQVGQSQSGVAGYSQSGG